MEIPFEDPLDMFQNAWNVSRFSHYVFAQVEILYGNELRKLGYTEMTNESSNEK